jgi:Nucleotide modification associated domain 3
MKIILSRKGFDSSSGGVPSPIFPDGQMLSLPIPDKSSPITYGEIAGNDWATVGELVLNLARIPQTHRAHLDPDLAIRSFPRENAWKPLFGQASSAESHLRNQGVGQGDVFVFFGLFRSVERADSKWRYVPGSKPIHAIFGWLQIAARVAVSAWPPSKQWAHYHPHFVRGADPSNVLYVAADRLKLPCAKSISVAGAGAFRSIRPLLCLTEPDASRPGLWLLPDWFHPENRNSVLSYHGASSRWQRCPNGVMLSSVSRGQEFVLDSEHYPEAIDWLRNLLSCASK